MMNDPVIASWSEAGYAQSWQRADGLADLLRFPWAIATALVGRERPPALVVDVGSGPGTFLAALLDAYPEARGVWIDASPEMRTAAGEALSGYGDRVEFVVADAAELAGIDAARGADVLLNSRVAHHFDHDGLIRFYRDAATLVAPSGWAVTLDHILPPADFDRRYRDVLPLFAGSNAGKPTHPHYFSFPSMQDHLEALGAAGFSERDVAWRAFYTCLFVGRRDAQA